MAKTKLKLVKPAIKNRTVPLRRPNAEPRSRGVSDRCRGRAVDRGANAIAPAMRILAVLRAKKGSPATHQIRRDELRALRRLLREQERKSPFVFASERNAPFNSGIELERLRPTSTKDGTYTAWCRLTRLAYCNLVHLSAQADEKKSASTWSIFTFRAIASLAGSP
jgi:hypothetical protein